MAGGGIQLATAYVQMSLRRGSVVADTNSTLRQVERASTTAGTRSGQGFISKFGSHLRSAGATVGRGLLRGISGVLKAGAVGAVSLLGYALTKGFQRLSAIDQATHKLEGLGNSAKQTDAIMKNALASVKGTAFGMDEAATTAAGAVAAGVKPGKALTRTLSLTADAATIAGTSMGDMGSIFNKVATSNKVQGDVIAQLSDKGIPIVQLLSKTLHKSAGEVVDLASAGKINFAEFQKAMQQGLGGAAKKSGDTFTGAFANLKASLSRIGAGLLGGIFPQLAPSVTALTKAMSPLEDKAGGVGTAIGKVLAKALQKLPPLIANVQSRWREFKQGFTVGDLGPGAATFQKLGAAAKKLIDAFKGKDVGGGFDKIKTAITSLVKGVNGQNIQQLFEGLGKSAPIFNSALSLTGKALGLVADHAQTVGKFLPVILAAVLAHKALNATFGKNSLIGYNLRTAATIANAAANWANAAATRAATTAQEGNTAASNSGVIATVRQRVASAASAVAQRAMAAASRIAAAGQWLLNAAMDANPIALVIIGLVALGAAFVVLWKKSDTFRRIVTAAWNGIKAAALAVWHWMQNTLWPGIKKVWDSISGGFTAVRDAISRAWTKIKGYFSAAWSWVSGFFKKHWMTMASILLGPVAIATVQIYKHWGTIKGYFTAAKNWVFGAFRSAWNGVKSMLAKPVQGVKALFDREVRGWKRIFNGAVTAIKNIWSGIKSGLSAPINGVIRIINSPFVSGLNALLSHIPGVSFRVPKIPTIGKKAGGVLPGYTPGRDVHEFVGRAGRLLLSGGEAIMRPEWTRAVGPGFVDRMNGLARTGGVSAVRSALGYARGGILPTQRFFGGGIWNKIKDAGSGIWNGAKSLGELFTNPKKFITDKIGGLLKGVGHSFAGQIALGVSKKMISGIVSKVTGLFGGGSSGAGSYKVGAGARQWSGVAARALAAAGVSQSWLPLLLHRIQVESGGNPHAINLWDINAFNGDPSRGLMQTIGSTFNAYAGPYRSRGIYDPFANIYAAIMYTLRSPRWHGNFAAAWSGTHGYKLGGIFDPPVFDRGGTLAPGINVVRNDLGHPEPLVRADQAMGSPAELTRALRRALDGARLALDVDGRRTIGQVAIDELESRVGVGVAGGVG